jgi:hypothetical protein
VTLHKLTMQKNQQQQEPKNIYEFLTLGPTIKDTIYKQTETKNVNKEKPAQNFLLKLCIAQFKKNFLIHFFCELRVWNK